ncbi:hypothetical protein BX667DRAFT_463549, partial [Coemansia mojavensis]
DLAAMNDKFVDQVNMTAEIAHSRELVEAELEDLTQKLFTEANTMVAAEKKARAEAEKTAGHLRNVIADLETRLSSETMQSHELKDRIEKMMHGDGFRMASHAAALMAGMKAYPSSPGAQAPIRLDDQLLTEFREFAIQTQSQRQTNYMNMSYMKSVVSADVEPCLRFGPHPRISSRNVLDAIALNRIHIEEMTPQIAAEMRRLQQTSEPYNPNGCQACGRECQQCTYRFRMSNRADSEWIQVDTMCRDRLVAVCEFYGFVRYLRQGIFASRSIMELYMETIRLRLSMFYARIGA